MGNGETPLLLQTVNVRNEGNEVLLRWRELPGEGRGKPKQHLLTLTGKLTDRIKFRGNNAPNPNPNPNPFPSLTYFLTLVNCDRTFASFRTSPIVYILDSGLTRARRTSRSRVRPREAA